ncbi:LysR family transcriptional regulator [Butyrivibrio sp. VCD2006]|jgi:DNA-binding transcriptional LysR family regulator|uniref:LysR family transcriptional regulator n=1 Tax=Butyrivibrio sp. VCD2006 TaxID=1280664 RepID=UPI0004295B97|nr:LysR family transcriptional regulator [Butyrivibrio sp. VCD2006]
MDLFSLEIFIKVAEEKNITRAAEQLHLSQPTVSRRIREMEEELQKVLFIRTNKAVALTDAGKQFLEASTDIITIFSKAVQQDSGQETLTGDIYIGSGEIPAFSRLAAYIKDFRQQQPGIRFHILSGNAEEIRDDVEKGVLDLGLITRSVDLESCESLEFPEKARWGILVRADHPLARKNTIKAEDLEGESLILPENRVYQRELTENLSKDITIAASFTLAHNAVQLVRQGLGPMLCFDDPSLTAEELKFVTMAPYRDATPILFWKKRTIRSEPVDAFLHYIMENLNQ